MLLLPVSCAEIDSQRVHVFPVTIELEKNGSIPIGNYFATGSTFLGSGVADSSFFTLAGFTSIDAAVIL